VNRIDDHIVRIQSLWKG
jgi:hypothetical protein